MNDPALIKLGKILGIQDGQPRPGCAVAIAKEGKIIFQQCFGMASLEDSVPIQPETIFNIGSMSKQFTAFAIGLLEQEGKLSIEDDVRKHLPEMPKYDSKVTIRHLIFHTSGVRNSYPDLLWLGEWRDGDVTTFEDVKKLIFAQKGLNFQPGSEFQYSNSNYVLLAEICARASGMSFGEFSRKRIFEPLGMQASLIHDSCFTVIPRMARCYFRDDKGEWFLTLLNDSVIGPTNMYTNTVDLAKWCENLHTGLVGGLDLIQRMTTAGSLDDGTPLEYGWGLDTGASFFHRGWRMVEHGGSQAGYTSHMILFPELHMSVVFLSNYFHMLSREMTLKVADIFLEDHPAPQSVAGEGSKEQGTKKMQTFAPIPESWAGTYFSARIDSVREVKLKSGGLTYNNQELVRLGENRFCYRIDETVKLEFHDTPKDGVTLDITIPNASYHYEKVEPVQAAEIVFTEYTGRYYSPELDLYWIVELDSSQLVVKRRKYPLTRLTPLIKDAFKDDWQPIVDFPYGFSMIFSRDEQNKITGFRVSGGGVRHMHFERCS